MKRRAIGPPLSAVAKGLICSTARSMGTGTLLLFFLLWREKQSACPHASVR